MSQKLITSDNYKQSKNIIKIQMQIEQLQNNQEDQNNQNLDLQKQNNDLKHILNEEEVQQHKTLNHHSLYYSFLQRYFTNYITQDQAQFLHMHSNGLCLISVNPKAFQSPPILLKDFMEINQVKGKKKKGGIKTGKNTTILKIICQNGNQYQVKALIQGTVLQKNQKLSIQMLGKPQGYVVIILPSKKVHPEKIHLKKIEPIHQ